MIRILTFVFLLTLYLCAHSSEFCESFCRYRFCSTLIRDGIILQPENRALLLGLPNVPLGPIPCLRRADGRVILLSNVTGGESSVSPVKSDVPFELVSNYKKEVAGEAFPKDYFKWIDNDINRRQSIAKRQSAASQEKVIDQVCVRIPVASYELRRGDGSVRKKVKTSGSRACIGFRTQVPILLVEFQWNTANDFDIRLVEPNGFEINRFGLNSISPNNGKLNADIGGRTCQTEFGREQIRYLRKDSVVEPGEYKVRVCHLRSCSVSSSYKLRVLFNGQVILDERGTISQLGEDVVVKTFEIPA